MEIATMATMTTDIMEIGMATTTAGMTISIIDMTIITATCTIGITVNHMGRVITTVDTTMQAFTMIGIMITTIGEIDGETELVTMASMAIVTAVFMAIALATTMVD